MKGGRLTIGCSRRKRRAAEPGDCRGQYTSFPRKRVKQEETEVSWKPEVIEIDAPPPSKELKKRWSHFIRKVYETDPLTCPKCQGEMRIISFIDQPEVIKKILQKELPIILSFIFHH